MKKRVKSAKHPENSDVSCSEVSRKRSNDKTATIPVSDKKGTREYKYKLYTFLLISLLQIFVNYDIGVVPIILNWIQGPYNFSSTELGVMGSLPYIGFICVSPFLPYILLNYSSQKALTISFVLNLLSLLMFGFSIHKSMFFISKFCIGATQALFFSYYPIWVDVFSPEKNRNLWMSIIQGGIVVGMTLGYGLTSLFSFAGRFGWRYSIFAQVLCELILTVLLYLVPSEFVNFDPSRDEKINFDLCTCGNSGNPTELDSKYKLNPISESQANSYSKTVATPSTIPADDTSELDIESNVNFADQNIDNEDKISKPGERIMKKISNIGRGISFINTRYNEAVEFKIKAWKSSEIALPRALSLNIRDCREITKNYSNLEHSMINAAEYSKCSKCFINNVKLYQETMQMKNLSAWSKFKLLIKQSVFVLCCAATSMLYFEVTGIQYWMTNIGITHLNVKEKVMHLIFTIEMVSGPVLGIVSGSYIVDQIIHHYPQKPLLVDTVLITWAVIACVFGFLLSFLRTHMMFAVGIFIILYYGAAIVPTLTLTSIACLPHRLKPAGSSFFICQYQIFGFTLGTLLPGVAVDIFKNYHAAIFIIYLSGFVGLITLIMIAYIKWNRIRTAKLTGRSIYIKGAVVI